MARQPEPVPRSSSRRTRPGAIQGAKRRTMSSASGEMWDEHTRIDLDPRASEPGDTGEVRGRDALADATREQLPYAQLCRATDAPAVEGGAPRVRQAERMQHQRRGLIVGVVGAVAEEDPRARKAGRAARDEGAHAEGAAFGAGSARRVPGVRTCMK